MRKQIGFASSPSPVIFSPSDLLLHRDCLSLLQNHASVHHHLRSSSSCVTFVSSTEACSSTTALCSDLPPPFSQASPIFSTVSVASHLLQSLLSAAILLSSQFSTGLCNSSVVLNNHRLLPPILLYAGNLLRSHQQTRETHDPVRDPIGCYDPRIRPASDPAQ